MARFFAEREWFTKRPGKDCEFARKPLRTKSLCEPRTGEAPVGWRPADDRGCCLPESLFIHCILTLNPSRNKEDHLSSSLLCESSTEVLTGSSDEAAVGGSSLAKAKTLVEEWLEETP
jgi:hypothetical protein